MSFSAFTPDVVVTLAAAEPGVTVTVLKGELATKLCTWAMPVANLDCSRKRSASERVVACADCASPSSAVSPV